MHDTVDHAFAALSNATRRELLRILLERGPQPVQQLADHFSMRRPSVSEHLKVLRDAGLVREEKFGRQRFYRLEPEPLMEIRSWLSPYERYWWERVGALRQLLDANDDGGDRSGDADGGEGGNGALAAGRDSGPDSDPADGPAGELTRTSDGPRAEGCVVGTDEERDGRPGERG